MVFFFNIQSALKGKQHIITQTYKAKLIFFVLECKIVIELPGLNLFKDFQIDLNRL